MKKFITCLKLIFTVSDIFFYVNSFWTQQSERWDLPFFQPPKDFSASLGQIQPEVFGLSVCVRISLSVVNRIKKVPRLHPLHPSSPGEGSLYPYSNPPAPPTPPTRGAQSSLLAGWASQVQIEIRGDRV